MENEILGIIDENNVIAEDLISKIATENFLHEIEAELESRKLEQSQLLTISEPEEQLVEGNKTVTDNHFNIKYDVYGLKQFEMAVIGENFKTFHNYFPDIPSSK